MENKKEFGQGAFSTFTNHVYWLMVVNFYFVFSNIIFLSFYFTLEPVISNITIYFLALIPTGPSIAALYYSISKIIHEKDLSPTKDFFYGYKVNFKDALKLWLPLLAVIFVLILDIQYFNAEQTVMNQIQGGIILVILLVILVISLYAFPIHATYNFRMRDIYRLSLYYSFTKIRSTLGNISFMIITIFLMYMTSDLIIILLVSPVCYLMMLNSKEVMTDIKENFVRAA